MDSTVGIPDDGEHVQEPQAQTLEETYIMLPGQSVHDTLPTRASCQTGKDDASTTESTREQEEDCSNTNLFSALAATALCQGILSVMLLSFFRAICSDYLKENPGPYSRHNVDNIVSHVVSYSLSSLLFAIYTGVDCTILSVTVYMFLIWWMSSKDSVMLLDKIDTTVFLIIITLFLLVWFLYTRISPFLRLRRR
ncbi:uncharacterized protein FOMMEDRAFT_144085 [Fomitiporia mediterranea MF3/22]|uniref:uncharacterized protein n=1 Tax=Fomitiporia mediterranea (strain MF3/22) TaxID=694068 RepID=UPI0004407B9F|nr:uncharacterized protein FOMMEDRAFT_144085 [Fomitiporia mediterranea MF3/22]EJD07870.1 hypothetical protein FOMMEDRAFT_144085 [Fomitiporia mediterranea MF3/22]